MTIGSERTLIHPRWSDRSARWKATADGKRRSRVTTSRRVVALRKGPEAGSTGLVGLRRHSRLNGLMR